MPKVSDRSFYRDLAARLRRVDNVRTERTDRDQDALLKSGAVPLAEILDLLTGDDGGPVLAAARARVAGAMSELQENLARTGHSTVMGAQLHGIDDDRVLPRDPLDRQLARFFEGTWLGSRGNADLAFTGQAVVEAFSTVAGSDGFVTAAEASRLGPAATQLFEAMRARIAEVGDAKSDNEASKYEWLNPVTVRRVARSRSMPGAKARMPVLDEVTRMLGGEKALAGFRMASVQHLFPSTRGLYAALSDNGLDFGTTGVGGKGYSTDVDTMMRLTAEGYDVHPDGSPLAHRGASDASEVVGALARDQLRRLFDGVDPDADDRRRFLLLDEGGKLIKALHLHFPAYAKLCVCVEQTDRGIQVIEEAREKLAKEQAEFEATGRWPEPREGFELAVPVVNMARSEAKKQHESPMIGESCVFNLERSLDGMNPALNEALFQDPARRRACVIGYGAVGKAVADRLRARGFEVYVHDTDPARMAQAAADGCVPSTRDDALAQGYLTYGCTGRGVLTPSEYDLLPDGAVLANAASGNHELGLEGIDIDAAAGDTAQVLSGEGAKTRFRGLELKLGETDDPMRHRVWRTETGKELLLARSGYVVNMELDLPPEYAQLTRGLLLSSCLAAARSEAPGLVDIPAAAQHLVVGRTRKHLQKEGLSLEEPDFRKLPFWE